MPLTGRADELAAQPFNKLFPGFDVHYLCLCTDGCESSRNSRKHRKRGRPAWDLSSYQWTNAWIRRSRATTTRTSKTRRREKLPVSVIRRPGHAFPGPFAPPAGGFWIADGCRYSHQLKRTPNRAETRLRNSAYS